MLNDIIKLASGLDSNEGLSRLKTQGQYFNRAYAEFIFYRDFALSNPFTSQKWQALNRLALSTRQIVGAFNSHIDRANHLSQMVFGDSLLSLLPETANLYLMSGNAALAYAIQEMQNFNAGMARIVQETINNAESQTNPE